MKEGDKVRSRVIPDFLSDGTITSVFEHDGREFAVVHWEGVGVRINYLPSLERA